MTNSKAFQLKINFEGSKRLEIGFIKDYDLFLSQKGNRLISDIHSVNIAESMEIIGNVSSISCVYEIINGKTFYRIIDGQHRFDACKHLNKPIEYTVWNTDEKAMTALNANQKNWTLSDYLNLGIIQGKEDYIQIKEYVKRTGISLNSVVEIFGEMDELGKYKNKQAVFKTLRWKIHNKEEGEDILNKLFEFYKDYGIKHYNHNKFITAFKIIYNDPDYDHEKMRQQ